MIARLIEWCVHNRAMVLLLAVFLGSAPYAWFFAWTGDRLGRAHEKPGLALLLALAVPALYWIGFAIVARRGTRGD